MSESTSSVGFLLWNAKNSFVSSVPLSERKKKREIAPVPEVLQVTAVPVKSCP